MSTQPPPQPPPRQSDERSYCWGLPALLPLNGELVVFLAVLLAVAIIALASDRVDAGSLVAASVALAIGYMISRGIAKAGKVHEGH